MVYMLLDANSSHAFLYNIIAIIFTRCKYVEFMQYVISLDWFQVFCKGCIGGQLVQGTYLRGKTPSATGKYYQYRIDRAQEFHSIYKNSVTLFIDKFPIVHIHWHPRSSALDSKGVAVKVANRLLYSSTWAFHLMNVCDSLGLVLSNITRADLCADFTEFANGMLPSDFIHHYVRDTNSEDTESYIRRGSNKFEVIGVKRMVSDEGESSRLTQDSLVESCVSRFDYLRFGSRSSGVSTYLYNKSEELRSKHSKPWIRKSWVQGGLIKEQYQDGEVEPQVYRLEISVQSKSMLLGRKHKNGTINLNTIQVLSTSDFACQQALEETFWVYADKYFSFKICTGQKYVKDMKPLVLFDVQLVPIVKPVYINTNVNAGVAERNAALAINRLQWESCGITQEQQDILFKASKVLESLSISKAEGSVRFFKMRHDDTELKLLSPEQKQWLDKQVEMRVCDLLSFLSDPIVCNRVEFLEGSDIVAKDYLKFLNDEEGDYRLLFDV